MRAEITRMEVAALLSVAQDHAFGQPPGSQLRAAVLGQRLATELGLDVTDRATCWWASTLRFLGCTGHAFESAIVFGDEIELRAESLRADFADPTAVLRVMIRRAGPGDEGLARVRSVLAVIAGGRKAAELNFRMACEVGDLFAARLGVDDQVRAALGATFERWNGRGLPRGSKGVAIPIAMRIAHLCQEFEVLARMEDVGPALEIVARRSGGAYDPDLVRVVVEHGAGWWADVEPLDPWDAALELAPRGEPLDDAAVHEALVLLADFGDLKSPWIAGHSRAVAALAGVAAGPLAEEAALVHDLGRVGVPNTIWDKPGPLTRDERDRAETHALLTDQLLRRVPALAPLCDGAGGAHERLDGSGYHRRATGTQLDQVARVVAAADCYQAMVSDRPHRAALQPADAATELRAMSADGRLEGEAVERVLAAAGHRRSARPPLPAGLTSREVDVLRLLALGLTNRQVAEELVISAKTVDHHVQHIYAKIGVSTRGAAALFAIEHGVMTTDR
ncbi:MAG: HD domain-containing phosphohydrolase [Acidimicrobiales bacterium]